MALRTPVLALAGALAATTVFVAPASAAELPAASIAPSVAATAIDFSRFDPSSTTADWRCRRGCGYGHRGRHGGGYRRNRIGAGDVLIGVAIIGSIAAIANANNRRERQRDVVIVERDQRDWNRRENQRYDDRRSDRTVRRGGGASGLDNAVDQCLTRIERDVRVDTVDNVERNGAGWLVSGALFNGSGFQCRIGNSGQIEGIDYGGGFSSAPATGYRDRADGQWDERRYADARMAMGGMAQPDANAAQAAALPSADRMPAYPGGPVPGDVIPETIDGDL